MRIPGLMAFVVALCLGGAGPALAYTIDPTVSVIELPQDASGTTLILRNPREFPLAVTFEIFERDVREDGTEGQTPADEDFLIFPPQAVVPAGQTQAIRVQWIGEQPSLSRSFTLYGVEAPVDLTGEETSGVRTILRIGATVHVTSSGLAPVPVLSSWRETEDGVEVSLTNNGNRFVYVDELELTFGETRIGGIELGNIAERTLIPPGVTRTFLVPDVSGEPTLRLRR